MKSHWERFKTLYCRFRSEFLSLMLSILVMIAACMLVTKIHLLKVSFENFVNSPQKQNATQLKGFSMFTFVTDYFIGFSKCKHKLNSNSCFVLVMNKFESIWKLRAREMRESLELYLGDIFIYHKWRFDFKQIQHNWKLICMKFAYLQMKTIMSATNNNYWKIKVIFLQLFKCL